MSSCAAGAAADVPNEKSGIALNVAQSTNASAAYRISCHRRVENEHWYTAFNSRCIHTFYSLFPNHKELAGSFGVPHAKVAMTGRHKAGDMRGSIVVHEFSIRRLPGRILGHIAQLCRAGVLALP
jgi:hypothetical protein